MSTITINENLYNESNSSISDMFLDTSLGKKAVDTFSQIFSDISNESEVKSIVTFLTTELGKYSYDTNNYKFINTIIECIYNKYPDITTKDLHTDTPSFVSAFKSVSLSEASLHENNIKQYGETTNGDINYITMGSNIWSLFMEMSNKNVMPPIQKSKGPTRKGQKSLCTNFMGIIPPYILNNCTSYMEEIFSSICRAPIMMQSIYLDILWRLVFFERAIASSKRVDEGKGNKVIFYLLFTLYAKKMPQSAVNMCHLIPHYGCMKDIKYLLIHYLEENNIDMINALQNVFLESIDKDIRTLSQDRGILLSKGPVFTMSEYRDYINDMNTSLKKMSPDEIKTKYSGITMVGKYWPSEDTVYSNAMARNEKRSIHGKIPLPNLRKRPFSHLNNILTGKLFFPEDGSIKWDTMEEKSRNFYLMLIRKTKSVLNLIIDTVEVRMSSNEWKYIEPKRIPGKALFQHRCAFLNETIGDKLSIGDSETGNRTNNIDRIDLRKRMLLAAEKGELKSGGDSIDFAKTCMKYQELHIGGTNCIGSNGKVSLSAAARATLNAQFNALVEDHIVRLETEYKKKLDQWIEMGSYSGDEPLNPFYCAFITDVSGSMGNLMYYAIVLALIGIRLSKLTKGSITFSTNPSFILLEEDGDFVSWFQQIARDSNWGGSTNIEAAFMMMLDMMKKVRAIDPTFNGKVSLTVFTDMMFNPANGMTGPPLPFVERMTKMFTDEGFVLPLTCFWNMNGNTGGFSVESDTPGVVSVEGLNSGMMMSALGGGVEFKKDTITGVTTAATNPLVSFLKRLSNPDYNKVSDCLYSTKEGPFANKLNVARNQLFMAFNLI